MEDDTLNRFFVGVATYYPLQVYLALLHAEVDYFSKYCADSSLVSDDTLAQYLAQRAEYLSALEGFRDFYLHPSHTDAAAETKFLRSYNMAPNLQTAVDDYLERTRVRLQGFLNEVLYSLPSNDYFALLSS